MSEKKRVPASPKTRKFARELGVDVNLVTGTRREGRVIEEDIKKFIKDANNSQNKIERVKTTSEYQHSEFGEIEIKDIPRVKKLAAVHLSHSWNTIPHVTNHDEADVTDMENFRKSLTDYNTGEKKKNNPSCFYNKSISCYTQKISYI